MRGDPPPFFSVITAAFNAAADIGALRASILAQSEDSWEWVVQDAASSDSTMEQVAAESDARIRAESRKDSGIYDGLNRAIARAHGRFFVILGADDVLAAPDVLARLRTEIETSGSSPDVVLGAAEVAPGVLFRSSVGLKTLVTNTVHHQGAAYAASQFADFSFDLAAPVVADYEHSLRLFLRKGDVQTSDLVIARCGELGISHRVEEATLYRQMHQLRSKYLPRPISSALEVVGIANVQRRALGRRLRGSRRLIE